MYSKNCKYSNCNCILSYFIKHIKETCFVKNKININIDNNKYLYLK